MAKTRLLVVGAGGHGQSVAEAAELSGEFRVVGFLDDSLPPDQKVLGHSVLGSVASMVNHRSACDSAIVAIGKNDLRQRLMQQLIDEDFVLATVIHPRAFVSPSARIGKGSAIMAGGLVGTQARLGVGVIVNCGAVVDHHACVEDFGHLGVNACMAGGSSLGKGSWMQAGASLGYGVVVPPYTVLRPGQALPR